ncbi:MAG: alpha-E domain-containing protein [Treponema sp.]|jgi:uncharacterized alpha-E superfamily protein|nr:alpha-E domain-containing protein [Treponema sp.]
MGVISLEHRGNLYWLGRYAERVYATLHSFFDHYDITLDKDKNSYKKFLDNLEIEDHYGDYHGFIRGFLFDKKDENSISAAFHNAYDNALVIRNSIGSEALAYIQLAMDVFHSTRDTKNLRLALMPVMDYMLAFWGSIDDKLIDGEARTIIKGGKLVERMDLYFRFNYEHKLINSEYEKLCNVLSRAPKGLCNTQYLAILVEVMAIENSYKERQEEVLDSLNKLFEEQTS